MSVALTIKPATLWDSSFARCLSVGFSFIHCKYVGFRLSEKVSDEVKPRGELAIRELCADDAIETAARLLVFAVHCAYISEG